MITVEICIGNDTLESAKYELRSFLRHQDAKMAGDVPDTRGTAATGYVLVRRFLARIEEEEAAQLRERRKEENRRSRPPTVRESRQ